MPKYLNPSKANSEANEERGRDLDYLFIKNIFENWPCTLRGGQTGLEYLVLDGEKLKGRRYTITYHPHKGKGSDHGGQCL